MSTAQVVILIIGGVAAAVVGLAGIVAAIWSVARIRKVESTLDILDRANVSLTREVARLEGQVEALTGGLAERIVSAVLTAVERSRP